MENEPCPMISGPAEDLGIHLSEVCGRTITIEMLAFHICGVAML